MRRVIGDCKHYFSPLKFCELPTIVYSDRATCTLSAIIHPLYVKQFARHLLPRTQDTIIAVVPPID